MFIFWKSEEIKKIYIGLSAPILCSKCNNQINFGVYQINKVRKAYSFLELENTNLDTVIRCPICDSWYKKPPLLHIKPSTINEHENLITFMNMEEKITFDYVAWISIFYISLMNITNLITSKQIDDILKNCSLIDKSVITSSDMIDIFNQYRNQGILLLFKVMEKYLQIKFKNENFYNEDFHNFCLERFSKKIVHSMEIFEREEYKEASRNIKFLIVSHMNNDKENIIFDVFNYINNKNSKNDD